jgi:hypothetical protein
MPSKSANVKNEKQYERLKEKGMSKQRAARIANSPDASKHGGRAPERFPTQNRAGRPPKRRKRAAKAARQLLRSHEVVLVHFPLGKRSTWTKGMIWIVGLPPVGLIVVSGTTATP